MRVCEVNVIRTTYGKHTSCLTIISFSLIFLSSLFSICRIFISEAFCNVHEFCCAPYRLVVKQMELSSIQALDDSNRMRLLCGKSQYSNSIRKLFHESIKVIQHLAHKTQSNRSKSNEKSSYYGLTLKLLPTITNRHTKILNPPNKNGIIRLVRFYLVHRFNCQSLRFHFTNCYP